MRAIMMTVAGLGVALASGCGSVEDSCERFCDKSAECGDSASNCESECIDDIEDASSECQDSLANLAECMDENSCSEISDGRCAGPTLSFLGDCGEDLGMFATVRALLP